MTRLLLGLIARVSPPADRECIVGDTVEELHRRVVSEGSAAARRWLLAETWRVLRHAPRHRAVVRRVRRHDRAPRNLVAGLLQDARFAARVLRQRPGFTTAAVVTLALGIGANVAVFSAVRVVLLDEPPYPDGHRLVRLSIPVPRRVPQPLSAEDVEAIRSRSQVFEVVGACTWATVNVRGEGDLERVQGPGVTPVFFDVFGVPPVLGRLFDASEFATGARVTILSHRIWHSQFGGAADVVGRAIHIDREPWTIVGVMPGEFSPECPGLTTGDVWRPFAPPPGGQEANLLAYARLGPGVSLELARQTADELRTANASAALGAYGAAVDGLNDRNADFTRPGLLLLQGVAGFLLLLMCVNLANLFLAHASARQHELGVRAALGAGRSRLVRQLLAEAGLIAAAGSLVGLALAFWVVPRLVLTGPGRLGLLPEGTVLDLSWLELTVGLGLGWGAALLFGLAPAWLTSKTDVLAALRTSRQATAPRTISFLRASLVAVQVLMAVVILSGAGILIRSFANVIALPLGFEPRGLVAANVYVDAPSDARADVGRLERALRARLGGASLTIANSMPFFGYTGSTNFALLPDETTVPDWDHSQIRTVLPSYFSTMRTPLIRGRLLTSDDAGVQPTPVLVNETFAQKFGGGQDILGRRLLRAWLGGGSPPQDNQMVIVGVLQDARVIGWLSTPREAVYTLLDSSRAGHLALGARGATTAALDRAIREAARETGVDLAILRVDRMETAIAAHEVRRTFYLMALSTFGALAALLAAIGVYAVMSQAVGQRMRETGIRLALGARHGDIRRLLIGGGLKPIAIGLAGGVLAAWWVAGLLKDNAELKLQLYQVPAQDPTSIAATVAGLLLAGILACWIPASRVKRVNPVDVLRVD